jgi:hypothetical protein
MELGIPFCSATLSRPGIQRGTNMDIQIVRDGQQTGPYTEDAVHELLKDGAVRGSDLAWRPGLPDWVPLTELLNPGATSPEPEMPEAPASAGGEPATEPEHASRESEENQARKEQRAQHFLGICHGEGAPLFEKVTHAHCKVLVAHLDAHAPNWDAEKKDAAAKHFFPALAEKFPQLLTAEGKARFNPAKAPVPAKAAKSTPAPARKSPSSRPGAGKVIYAMLRGVFVGLIVLALLWIGRGALLPKKPLPKMATPAATADPTPAAAAETRQ